LLFGEYISYKSSLPNPFSSLEPLLKKHLFPILLILFIIVDAYAGAELDSNDLEVYIDIPLHLDLNLSSTAIALEELAESGESSFITFNIRANKTPWTLSAKATYAALTWGSKLGGTWTAPATPLSQIPYKVSLVDESSSEVLFPLASLPVNINQALKVFTRKTTGGANGENFTFTLAVDPMSATDDWESGIYQDTIVFTITAP